MFFGVTAFSERTYSTIQPLILEIPDRRIHEAEELIRVHTVEIS